jgi:hypothetical protein
MGKAPAPKGTPLFDDDEREALRAGIQALEQKAASIASFGPWASKGPIVLNMRAASTLRRIMRRKK